MTPSGRREFQQLLREAEESLSAHDARRLHGKACKLRGNARQP